MSWSRPMSEWTDAEVLAFGRHLVSLNIHSSSQAAQDVARECVARGLHEEPALPPIKVALVDMSKP